MTHLVLVDAQRDARRSYEFLPVNEVEIMVEYETMVTADLAIAGIYGDIIFIIFTF